jgi:hypothetical protein
LDRAGKLFFRHIPGHSIVGASREARDRAPDPPASLCGNPIDRTSGWNSFPADAFSAQYPSFRATIAKEEKRTKVKGAMIKPHPAREEYRT